MHKTKSSCSSSSIHLFAPSTSLASQSSLEIIMENSECPINSSKKYRGIASLASKKDEYEDLSNNDPKTDTASNRGAGSSSIGSRGGAQGWRNVRAVMAYYCTLRKIKRNGSFFFLFSFHNLQKLRNIYSILLYI